MHVVRFSVPAMALLILIAIATTAASAPRVVPGALGAPAVTPLAGRTDQDVPGANPNPGVLPINTRPLGRSYANWGVEWWRWALSFPASSNPIFDPTGAFQQQGQPNGVFFLAGNTGGATTRSVTIPKGTMVFFPLVNFDITYPCPDPTFVPGPGQTLEEFLQEFGDFIMGFVGPMSAELDGRQLIDLHSYRAQSDLATVTGDPSLTAVFDPCITGSEQFFVSDGFWLMLKPLTPGAHTLHWTASIPDFGFAGELTYHITVTSGSSATTGQEPMIATPVSSTSWGRLKTIYR